MNYSPILTRMLPGNFSGRNHGRLKPKLSTVEEVVRTMVHDGDYIGIGGFGANRIPTAILHEIVRQGKNIWVLRVIPPHMTSRSWLRVNVLTGVISHM